MDKPRSTRRGRHFVWYLMIVVAFVLGAAFFASPAAAEQPITWEDNSSGSYVITGICSFPVSVEYTVTQTLTAFINDSGEWVMGHHHGVEQDTFSANGKTLVGMPYAFNIHNYFEPNPEFPIWLHGSFPGVYWKFPLPDGGMFIVAGQVKCDLDGCTSVGNPGDFDALCAALAP